MTSENRKGRGMTPAPTVTLSYEERIINALSRVTHKRADDRLTRDKKDFDAIREVLRPLYEERDGMREALDRIYHHSCGECCRCAFAGGAASRFVRP